MRRFLIWSGLSVLIGLVLAVGGVWAYNHFYVRFQPVTLDRNATEVQTLLDSASWVSQGGGGQAVYVVGYRDSTLTRAYLAEEAPKLHAAGADVRVVMFARPDRDGRPQSTPTERSTIAELWLTRDWGLYQRWMGGPSKDWAATGLAPADGSLARTAVVNGSRDFARRLGELLRAAGAGTDWPVVIWRDGEGFLKACACSDRRSWVFLRDDIGAPDALARPEAWTGPADEGAVPAPPPGSPAGPQAYPDATSQNQPLSYPRLPETAPQISGGPTAGSLQPSVVPPATPSPGAVATPPSRLERQRSTPPSTAQTPQRPSTQARPAPRPATRPPAAPRPAEEEDTRFY